MFQKRILDGFIQQQCLKLGNVSLASLLSLSLSLSIYIYILSDAVMPDVNPGAAV